MRVSNEHSGTNNQISSMQFLIITHTAVLTLQMTSNLHVLKTFTDSNKNKLKTADTEDNAEI